MVSRQGRRSLLWGRFSDLENTYVLRRAGVCAATFCGTFQQHHIQRKALYMASGQAVVALFRFCGVQSCDRWRCLIWSGSNGNPQIFYAQLELVDATTVCVTFQHHSATMPIIIIVFAHAITCAARVYYVNTSGCRLVDVSAAVVYREIECKEMLSKPSGRGELRRQKTYFLDTRECTKVSFWSEVFVNGHVRTRPCCRKMDFNYFLLLQVFSSRKTWTSREMYLHQHHVDLLFAVANTEFPSIRQMRVFGGTSRAIGV